MGFPPRGEDTADGGAGPAVGRFADLTLSRNIGVTTTNLRREGAMPLTELNHYFIRANNLEETKKFYCDVLGFEVMNRPSFPFPGYWLGVNGKIQVHMGPDGIDNADMYYLGTPKNAVTDHAGVVDHIAFLATEPGNFIRRFKERGMDFQPRSLPEFDLYQIFIKDPNGLTIELNFFGMKDVTDWGGEDYSKMPQAASMRA
jgi:catechol 2,3-dioxygenase-like lactoylglutathione lyase family enzyme